MPPIVKSIVRFYQSSIGKKIIVAVTGAAMILFVIAHMIGNLLVFAGPAALNGYAKKLADLGPLLTLARLGLLAAVALHILCTVQLVIANRAARPQPYGIQATRQASRASRTMILSGLTILLFVIYHLMHYTWGVMNNYYDPGNTRYFLPNGDHNVYNMVVDGFGWAPASLFYIVAMGLLFMHLSHGFASVFQTLGFTTPKARQVIELTGKLVALVLFAGNSLMPLAVLFGYVK
ncbi:MAG TPA: succinate dehydrogenase cytochrome b subunit [Verrucomicrobiales bacterium]|nr:succinate dehydrogenase cytochrome b subunit [Verrucomicrobiales bacterium]